MRAGKDISVDAFDALKVVQHRITYALSTAAFNSFNMPNFTYDSFLLSNFATILDIDFFFSGKSSDYFCIF